MAETMIPSVRGGKRIITTMVLAITIPIGAVIPTIVSATVTRSVTVSSPTTAILMCALTSTALCGDLKKVRPFALHRQVPMPLSHRRGASFAAAGYGIRLGFGPATILTTWLWWPWWITASLTGGTAVFAGSLAFALVRVLVVCLPGIGIVNGAEMARRTNLLSAAERSVERLTMLAAAGVCASLAIGVLLT